MACEICEREKAWAREEIRRLKAEGVPDELLSPAALKALEIPDHDTASHPYIETETVRRNVFDENKG